MQRPKSVTGAILFVILMVGTLIENVRADDVCDADGQAGMLDIAKVNQEETSWCWVASSNVITNRFGMTSPADQYSQCTLYNLAKNPADNCCAYPPGSRPSSCQDTGYPWDIFTVTTPNIHYQGEAYPMSWANIQKQICPAGGPGTPFIFIAKPATGGPEHTHVVKGYDTTVSGGGLWIDDHYVLTNCGADEVNCEMGARFINYECKYKLPSGCQEPSLQWNRVGDLYDLKKVSEIPHAPEGIAPSVPLNLRVQ